jgi:hypothetical protein
MGKFKDSLIRHQEICDRPLAAKGLTSYRYRGRYGWIMIGALNAADAVREAQRSTHGDIDLNNLEIWQEGKYQKINYEVIAI